MLVKEWDTQIRAEALPGEASSDQEEKEMVLHSA